MSKEIYHGETDGNSSPFRGCTGLKNLKIGNGIKEIMYSAFNNCSGLQEIIIPRSIETISYEPFKNCTKLTAITYKGSINEWKNLSKTSWAGGSSIVTVVCSDGEISSNK